jgi:hypothetical protein
MICLRSVHLQRLLEINIAQGGHIATLKVETYVVGNNYVFSHILLAPDPK